MQGMRLRILVRERLAQEAREKEEARKLLEGAEPRTEATSPS